MTQFQSLFFSPIVLLTLLEGCIVQAAHLTFEILQYDLERVYTVIIPKHSVVRLTFENGTIKYYEYGHSQPVKGKYDASILDPRIGYPTSFSGKSEAIGRDICRIRFETERDDFNEFLDYLRKEFTQENYAAYTMTGVFRGTLKARNCHTFSETMRDYFKGYGEQVMNEEWRNCVVHHYSFWDGTIDQQLIHSHSLA